jgi:hypothetical protein
MALLQRSIILVNELEGLQRRRIGLVGQISNIDKDILKRSDLVSEALNILPGVFDVEIVRPTEIKYLGRDLYHGHNAGSGAETVHGVMSWGEVVRRKIVVSWEDVGLHPWSVAVRLRLKIAVVAQSD